MLPVPHLFVHLPPLLCCSEHACDGAAGACGAARGGAPAAGAAALPAGHAASGARHVLQPGRWAEVLLLWAHAGLKIRLHFLQGILPLEHGMFFLLEGELRLSQTVLLQLHCTRVRLVWN